MGVSLMSGIRVSFLKSFLSSRIQLSSISKNFGSCGSCMKLVSCTDGVHAEALFAFSNRSYHTPLSHRSVFLHRSSPLTSPNGATITSIPAIISCSYVSFFGGKGEKPTATSGTNIFPSGDWVNQIKDVWKSTSDAVIYTGEKVKEVSNVLTPYGRRLLDSYPYLDKVIIPATCTLSAAVIAWLVMPRVLKRFHKYTQQGLQSRGLFGYSVPYENSIWGAMEDPVRYLVTFIAFSQIGVMIAPTSIASTVIPQVWRGSLILSFVWILQRWKTNLFSHSMAVKNVTAIDREKLMSLDKLSSVGLFSLGLMAFAEACGVAIQSILTVGGIGGVATAFAARDVLGNVLSGLSLQFSKPFSLGDTIKAGTIEGQVLEMGLTTTSLLNAEKLPVIVPNSLFSSQVIVNKSRAQCRAMVTKIPLQMDGLEKIPQISDEIKIMLKSNPKVFLGTDAPYCFLSRIENCFAELTLGCNLKNMSKGEWYATEQDILIHSARIIQRHGVSLGSI